MAKKSLIPGFRFHPTDDELVMYYLKKKLLGKKIIVNAVAEVNIYEFSPWDLPDKSSLKSGDLEWYFFCPKSKKYSSGCRSNRATEEGFWKATGKDRKVIYNGRSVASIKTLVFHTGHAGNGQRTNWVMHEYKMEDEHLANAGIIQDKFVLCKIFEKSGSGPKNGAQYGAPFNEEEWDHDDAVASCSRSQAVVGQDVGTISVDLKQKGPAITEPGSSTVTVSLNKTAKTLNNKKQKDPATITELGSSSITFYANDDDVGQDVAVVGQDVGAINCVDLKQKGPAITEPGSSTVTVSLNKTAKTLNNKKQKDPATITELGSSGIMFYANDDVMLMEDIASIMDEENGNDKKKGVEAINMEKGMAVNEDEDIYDDLTNLINLDDLCGDLFKTAEYTLDKIFSTDDLDTNLGRFYVD